jgi:hypothetical protein
MKMIAPVAQNTDPKNKTMKRLKTDSVELLSMATGCIFIASLLMLPVATIALILTLIIKLIS